jgi:FAD/FMN-containing dehydrogenase/ferredoxin
MHTVEAAGVGRAIYGSSPTAPPPTEFSAKEEPLEGRLARDLCALKVPGIRVISAVGERSLYSRDQTEIPRFMKEILFHSMPEVVVQVSSADAVSAILKFAHDRGIPIVPRGSGSSPFGGSIPVKGGIVLDVSVMDGIVSVNADAKIVTVEAGARWADVDRALEESGLALITSPSSRFSTVGGWISTGGMGINSLSQGHISGAVEEITLVVPDGASRKITKGDSLFPSLFGSEGQLGVITHVKLRARDRPLRSRPHLIMFGDVRDALSFAYALIGSAVSPAHVIYESALKFSLTNRALGGDRFPVSDAIIVSIEGQESEERFEQFLASAGLKEEKEYLARYMWNERYFPMKLRKMGPGLMGSEVVVPFKLMPDAMARANALCNELGLEPMYEVHFLNDGRGLMLSYYLTDQGNTIGFTLDAAKSFILSSMLIDIGARPYSIGVWNNAFVDADDKTRLARLREVKTIMDPRGIMNTGKLFTLSGRFGGVAGVVFSPRLMRPLLKTMRVFSPVTMRLMRTGYKFAERRFRPKARTELMKVADECAMCGACVSVCPAYLTVKDERVTARGKLLAVKAMSRGARLTKEHSDRIFLCMRCKACEQVCQSKLDLVSAFDILEKELETIHGKDAKEIENFIRYTENMPEYDELVKQGLVLGAPKHGASVGEIKPEEVTGDGV